MRVVNRLHKGTALLIESVDLMASYHPCRCYVTYAIAKRSLLAARTSAITGGSCWRGTVAPAADVPHVTVEAWEACAIYVGDPTDS